MIDHVLTIFFLSGPEVNMLLLLLLLQNKIKRVPRLDTENLSVMGK